MAAHRPEKVEDATGTDRGSDRYFPADFDDRIDRQLEIIGQVGGVALHESE
jgi:hypothetical protein